MYISRWRRDTMLWLTFITAGLCLYITLDLPFFNSFVLFIRGVHNIILLALIYALAMVGLIITRPKYVVGDQETVDMLVGKWTAMTFHGEITMTFAKNGGYDYYTEYGTHRSGNYRLLSAGGLRLFNPDSSELYHFILEDDTFEISLYDKESLNSIKFMRDAGGKGR